MLCDLQKCAFDWEKTKDHKKMTHESKVKVFKWLVKCRIWYRVMITMQAAGAKQTFLGNDKEMLQIEWVNWSVILLISNYMNINDSW